MFAENELDESEQEAFSDIHKERYPCDPVFEAFLKRIRLNPGHVLRYHSNDDPDASPLWFSSYELPSRDQLDKRIGQCTNCNGERRLEFQVQPNLINDLWKNCRLTFGILAVYTCQSSCSLEQGRFACRNEENPSQTKQFYGSYIPECVIKQQEKFCNN